jgi:hypothetical protein
MAEFVVNDVVIVLFPFIAILGFGEAIDRLLNG